MPAGRPGSTHNLATRAAERVTGKRWCISGMHFAPMDAFGKHPQKCEGCLARAKARRPGIRTRAAALG